MKPILKKINLDSKLWFKAWLMTNYPGAEELPEAQQNDVEFLKAWKKIQEPETSLE